MSFKKVVDIHNIEHDDTASAKKVLAVDATGTPIDSDNPLPVTGGLAINNSIDQIGFDLNANPFSATTNISNDFAIDSIILSFTTTESKTITITDVNGTILLGGTLDTSSDNNLLNTTRQDFNLIFGQGFDAGDNVTVAVTQTAGACLMDVTLKTRQGAVPIVGNPVFGAGNELIGRVTIEPITDVNPKTFADTSFVVGDSPVILDVNAALGRNGVKAKIINDGAGSFTVAVSNDGISFGDEYEMKNGEVDESLDGVSIDQIRITHVTDSAYRVRVV